LAAPSEGKRVRLSEPSLQKVSHKAKSSLLAVQLQGDCGIQRMFSSPDKILLTAQIVSKSVIDTMNFFSKKLLTILLTQELIQFWVVWAISKFRSSTLIFVIHLREARLDIGIVFQSICTKHLIKFD